MNNNQNDEIISLTQWVKHHGTKEFDEILEEADNVSPGSSEVINKLWHYDTSLDRKMFTKDQKSNSIYTYLIELKLIGIQY